MASTILYFPMTLLAFFFLDLFLSIFPWPRNICRSLDHQCSFQIISPLNWWSLKSPTWLFLLHSSYETGFCKNSKIGLIHHRKMMQMINLLPSPYTAFEQFPTIQTAPKKSPSFWSPLKIQYSAQINRAQSDETLIKRQLRLIRYVDLSVSWTRHVIWVYCSPWIRYFHVSA